LNNEFNRLANGLIFKKTWSETEGLKSTSVKEVGVMDKRGGKFVTEDGKLHCAVFWTELFEVGGIACHFGLRDESTGRLEGHLAGGINGCFTNGEVNLNGLIFKAHTFDGNWDTTSELTKWGVNLSHGVGGTNDLVD
jgi:hypothetical protein